MTPHQELIYNDLKLRYSKSTLSKREMAHELSISYSTIDGYIANGYGVPDYIKNGRAKNAKILFPIIDVAKFLSQTIKTA